MINKLYSNMNSSNTALILIDFINSCVDKKCENPKRKITFNSIRKIIPVLETFLTLYRQKVKGMIVFTNTVPWQKEYLSDNLNELYTDPKTYYYSDDNSGHSEEFYQVYPEDKDIIITKNTYDAFADTKLEKVLKEKGIKYLVIAGIFGDGCVLSTVVSGFSKGFNFIFLKDLIETSDDVTRQKLLELLKEYTFPIMYGKTITSTEFLENWK